MHTTWTISIVILILVIDDPYSPRVIDYIRALVRLKKNIYILDSYNFKIMYSS